MSKAAVSRLATARPRTALLASSSRTLPLVSALLSRSSHQPLLALRFNSTQVNGHLPTETTSGPAVPQTESAAVAAAARLKPAGDPNAANQVFSPHPKLTPDPNRQWKAPEQAEQYYVLRNPVYSEEELKAVRDTRREMKTWTDKIAFHSLHMVRKVFDKVTGFKDGQVGVTSEQQWLNRLIFLETVAAIPGMVAGMSRHMRSLRLMRRDYGWVRTMLEEAENERMHLLTWMALKQPGPFFRLCVLIAQGTMFNFLFLAYLIHPKLVHRFVGYLEEEAVHTYNTTFLDMEKGTLTHWTHTPAPPIAVNYWRMKEGATLKDLVMVIRADEAEHRDVHHTLACLKADQPNPFGQYKAPTGGAAAEPKKAVQTQPAQAQAQKEAVAAH
ncbi:hypothetical protein HK104_001017 [Borealophlyctis nickersoniae]|nr:hypothetical protein HK104_001017 [Borealophlyctis nickersoniae]